MIRLFNTLRQYGAMAKKEEVPIPPPQQKTAVLSQSIDRLLKKARGKEEDEEEEPGPVSILDYTENEAPVISGGFVEELLKNLASVSTVMERRKEITEERKKQIEDFKSRMLVEHGGKDDEIKNTKEYKLALTAMEKTLPQIPSLGSCRIWMCKDANLAPSVIDNTKNHVFVVVDLLHLLRFGQLGVTPDDTDCPLGMIQFSCSEDVKGLEVLTLSSSKSFSVGDGLHSKIPSTQWSLDVPLESINEKKKLVECIQRFDKDGDHRFTLAAKYVQKEVGDAAPAGAGSGKKRPRTPSLYTVPLADFMKMVLISSRDSKKVSKDKSESDPFDSTDIKTVRSCVTLRDLHKLVRSETLTALLKRSALVWDWWMHAAATAISTARKNGETSSRDLRRIALDSANDVCWVSLGFRAPTCLLNSVFIIDCPHFKWRPEEPSASRMPASSSSSLLSSAKVSLLEYASAESVVIEALSGGSGKTVAESIAAHEKDREFGVHNEMKEAKHVKTFEVTSVGKLFIGSLIANDMNPLIFSDSSTSNDIVLYGGPVDIPSQVPVVSAGTCFCTMANRTHVTAIGKFENNEIKMGRATLFKSERDKHMIHFEHRIPCPFSDLEINTAIRELYEKREDVLASDSEIDTSKPKSGSGSGSDSDISSDSDSDSDSKTTFTRFKTKDEILMRHDNYLGNMTAKFPGFFQALNDIYETIELSEQPTFAISRVMAFPDLAFAVLTREKNDFKHAKQRIIKDLYEFRLPAQELSVQEIILRLNAMDEAMWKYSPWKHVFLPGQTALKETGRKTAGVLCTSGTDDTFVEKLGVTKIEKIDELDSVRCGRYSVIFFHSADDEEVRLIKEKQPSFVMINSRDGGGIVEEMTILGDFNQIKPNDTGLFVLDHKPT